MYLANRFSYYPLTLLVSVQDWGMVCSERTTGSKTIWSHPMELLGDVGQVGARFDLFRDGVNFGARSGRDLR
jgi:hypothetical protein